MLMRSFTAFNADQVEGPAAEKFRVKDEPANGNAAPDFVPAEELIAATQAEIRHGGDQAYYRRPVPEDAWPDGVAGSAPPSTTVPGGLNLGEPVLVLIPGGNRVLLRLLSESWRVGRPRCRDHFPKPQKYYNVLGTMGFVPGKGTSVHRIDRPSFFLEAGGAARKSSQFRPWGISSRKGCL